MKKVSKNKIALTYGLALYEAAAQTKLLDKVIADVDGLRRLIAENADFVAAFSNPIWEDAAKRETLAAIAAKLKWNPETLRCLDIVMDNNRFKELPLILEQFKHIYHQKMNLAEVEVESVKPLSEAQCKKLSQTMEAKLGKKAVVNYKINPGLLGGLKVMCGSDMIDDSLKSKLNRLENMMKGN